MRVLVGWEDPAEAETIDLCLNVEDTVATVTTDVDQFRHLVESTRVDAILLSLDFPTKDDSFELFRQLRSEEPNRPISGAWRAGEINQAAKFISEGMHSYVIRDGQGEFVFLLAATIEAVETAILAKRAEQLADRLREEVESVRRLQESVIPQDIPTPDGYEIVARYEPSQIRVVGGQPVVMAGGDYYDVFGMGDDTAILIVGDAAGHGVKACMSIMTMHTLIGMIRTHSYRETSEFVGEVNRRLCGNDVVQDQGGFITLLYSTLDWKEHRLQWTSAGHPMPVLHNLETNEIKPMADEDAGGLPLAISAEWEYDTCEAVIPPNSRLLLYTDGLEEAFPEGSDDEADQFGVEGIYQCLRECAKLSANETLEELFARSSAATKGSGRHDDTSVMIIDRLK